MLSFGPDEDVMVKHFDRAGIYYLTETDHFKLTDPWKIKRVISTRRVIPPAVNMLEILLSDQVITLSELFQ